MDQTLRILDEEDYDICTEDELQMGDADSIDASDDDEEDEEDDDNLDDFLVGDDYNSEEDMEFVPVRKNLNKN